MSKSIKSSAELSALPAYELVHEEYLDDIKSCGLVFRHKKSGARVCVISNDDDNKVFCAGFRTTPTDSTGVPHITEHSVLNGSKNFPSRDPFMSLVKGSLNTFLNAMTYPDKTIYPVASCNDKDFKNLMHVYIDAVFHPLTYSRPEIMQQEGWHYELESPDDELKINGVVYSEMKGALSSADSLMYEGIQHALYPDNTYGVNSGGDPDFIPDLTYENFLDFHRRYYHPVNSYIYLYGDVDIEERLTWMDENYLSEFDIIELDSHIEPQSEWDGIREEYGKYSVGADDKTEGKTYFGYATLAGEANVYNTCAWRALGSALLDTGAPLLQALQDAGIGNQVYGGYEGGILQPMFTVIAKEAKAEDKDKFFEIIDKVLREQVKNGINKNALLSAINSDEFSWREADFGGAPKGLLYIITSFESWLYDDSKPFDFLKRNEIYEDLRKKIDEGYFEGLIEQYLLTPKHELHYVLEPERGLLDRKNEALREKLAAYKASLSKEEVEAIVASTKHLREYQSAPPTEEEINCIPSITREDIDKKSKAYTNEEKTLAGIPAVYHDVNTNGITYCELMFRTESIPTELIPFVGLLRNVLGSVDTSKHSYFELSNDIGINTGGISYSCGAIHLFGHHDEFVPYTNVSFSALSNKVSYAMELVGEVLSSSKIHDKKRLYDIITEHLSGKLTRFGSSGNRFALERAKSYIMRTSLFEEKETGIDAYMTLKALMEDYDKNYEYIADSLEKALQYMYRPENLIVSYASDVEGEAELEKSLPQLVASLHTCEKASGEMTLEPTVRNEGLMMPIQVQYVARVGDFEKKGFKYSGALDVLRSSLNIDYLYQEIRVKGGAYGQGCSFSQNDGILGFSSYRDPQLKNTDEVYKRTPEFIRSLSLSNEELTKLIIGTISDVDQPRTPRTQKSISFSAYLRGMTTEDLQKTRDEILNVTTSQLVDAAELVEKTLEDSVLCVIGNDTKLRENKDMFGSLVSLS
ncbi:MAG: insulinase family protein [Firmicutes bacterium]|nr:insulinase family protein [Bacillota bacterium]